MRKKIVCTILVLLFGCGIAFSAYQIYKISHEYEEGQSIYEDLSEYVELPDRPEGPDIPTVTQSESGETEDDIAWPQVDFDALKDINSDIVGWIYLEGSEINYPIAQSEDNSYYLKHLFDKSSNSSGCIFLDCRNTSDFSDRHSIIYGHHMKNGTMFSGLDAYKSQEYYDAHPQILLLTPEENYVIEIFAGYVASVIDDAWQIGFASDADFKDWLARAIDRSCFDSDITPAATDRTITLSTCSYEFNNARFVLLGILQKGRIEF